MDATTNSLKVKDRDIPKEQRLARLRQLFQNYRLIYSHLDKNRLRQMIYEESQLWEATMSEVVRSAR